MIGLESIKVAAVSAGVIMLGVAVFQMALALGLPLGHATFGGNAPNVDGVLTPGFRMIAVINAAVLLGFAWVLLVRAGVFPAYFVGERAIVWAAWGIVAFLVLNTLGNITAPHPVERYVMGTVTFVLVILCILIVLKAPVTTS